MATVGIVDIGLGNITSVEKMFARADVPTIRTADRTALAGATHLVLPGVGSFDAGVKRLDDADLRSFLTDRVVDGRVPFLGICLGMQLLASSSEEGSAHGLGWIDGESFRLQPGQSHRVPNMGWHPVNICKGSELFEPADAHRFYFLHSYALRCRDPRDVLLSIEYGGPVTAAVQRDNIVGVQFHPEKSHRHGVELFTRFASST